MSWHIPLEVSTDIYSKKKPWPNLHWIGEDSNCLHGIDIDSHYLSIIHLPLGQISRVNKLESVLKSAIVIGNNSAYVYGILSSGKLFFWNSQKKNLELAEELFDLATVNLSRPGNTENKLHGLFKILSSWRSHATEIANAEHQINAGSARRDTSQFPRLNIFADDLCTKVLIVCNSSQVYLWERVASPVSKSALVMGNWSCVDLPCCAPWPNPQCSETEVVAMFHYEGGPFELQCDLSFCFGCNEFVVISTLSFCWGELASVVDSCKLPSTQASFMRIPMARVSSPERQKGLNIGNLLSRYAYQRQLLCVAVNSVSKCCLLFLSPTRKSAVISNCICDEQNSVGKHARSSWISDLAWSVDSTYAVGCLRSGSVFMASRFGCLVRISCTGDSLALPSSTFLHLHPQSSWMSESVMNNSTVKTPCHVECHPTENSFLVSSSHRLTICFVPKSASGDDTVFDQLISSGGMALHILRNSAVAHMYECVHASNWSLASQLPSGTSIECENEVNGVGNIHCELIIEIGGLAESEEASLIQNVVEPLLSAWCLAASYSGPPLQEWRKRCQQIVLMLLELFGSLAAVITEPSELGACVDQLLGIAIRFISVLSGMEKSAQMFSCILNLLIGVSKILLENIICNKLQHGVHTLQTLVEFTLTVKALLIRSFSYVPVIQNPERLWHRAVLPAASAIISSRCKTIHPFVSHLGDDCSFIHAVEWRLKKQWLFLYCRIRKVYLQVLQKSIGSRRWQEEQRVRIYQSLGLIMGRVQEQLQNVGHEFSHSSSRLVSGGNRLFLTGMISTAVDHWKTEIIKALYAGESCSSRRTKHRFHSILYMLVLRRDWLGVARFLFWVNRLVFDVDQLYADNAILLGPRAISADKNASKVTNAINVPTLTAARQLVGSWGRILAIAFLGQDFNVPSSHHSVSVRTIVMESNVVELHDSKISGTVISSTEMSAVISKLHWTTQMACKALALAGYWGDVAYLCQKLGDPKGALTASYLCREIDPISESGSCDLASLVSNLLIATKDVTTITNQVWQGCSEALQLAAMAGASVIPNLLQMCICEIRNSLEELNLIVVNDVHLPAPPVFCSQLMLENGLCKKEVKSRKEISSWVKLFTLVVSTSGLSVALIYELRKEAVAVGKVNSAVIIELDKFIPLKSSGKIWFPSGEEWQSILVYWKELLKILWVVHARDQLSLAVRKHVCFVPIRVKKKREQCKETFQILKWCKELDTKCSRWQHDILATALAAAGDCPPSTVAVELLAEIIPELSELPTLLRDRADRLLLWWSKFSLADDGQNLIFEIEEEKANVEGRNLSTLYQEYCQSNMCSAKEHVTKIRLFCDVDKNTVGEFWRVVSLFVAVSFGKDAEMFSELKMKLPILPQFRDALKKQYLPSANLIQQIRKRWKVKGYRSNSKSCGSIPSDKERDSSCLEKRGLIRNLPLSGISMQGVSSLVCVFSQKLPESSHFKRSRSLSESRSRFDSENAYFHSPTFRSEQTSRLAKIPDRFSRRSHSVRMTRQSFHGTSATYRAKNPLMLSLTTKDPQLIVDIASVLQDLLESPLRTCQIGWKQVPLDWLAILFWIFEKGRTISKLAPLIFSSMHDDNHNDPVSTKLCLEAVDVGQALLWQMLERKMQAVKQRKEMKPEISNSHIKLQNVITMKKSASNMTAPEHCEVQIKLKSEMIAELMNQFGCESVPPRKENELILPEFPVPLPRLSLKCQSGIELRSLKYLDLEPRSLKSSLYVNEQLNDYKVPLNLSILPQAEDTEAAGILFTKVSHPFITQDHVELQYDSIDLTQVNKNAVVIEGVDCQFKENKPLVEINTIINSSQLLQQERDGRAVIFKAHQAKIIEAPCLPISGMESADQHQKYTDTFATYEGLDKQQLVKPKVNENSQRTGRVKEAETVTQKLIDKDTRIGRHVGQMEKDSVSIETDQWQPFQVSETALKNVVVVKEYVDIQRQNLDNIPIGRKLTPVEQPDWGCLKTDKGIQGEVDQAEGVIKQQLSLSDLENEDTSSSEEDVSISLESETGDTTDDVAMMDSLRVSDLVSEKHNSIPKQKNRHLQDRQPRHKPNLIDVHEKEMEHIRNQERMDAISARTSCCRKVEFNQAYDSIKIVSPRQTHANNFHQDVRVPVKVHTIQNLTVTKQTAISVEPMKKHRLKKLVVLKKLSSSNGSSSKFVKINDIPILHLSKNSDMEIYGKKQKIKMLNPETEHTVKKCEKGKKHRHIRLIKLDSSMKKQIIINPQADNLQTAAVTNIKTEVPPASTECFSMSSLDNEKIDKGFLDQLEEYTKKFEVGKYGEMLKKKNSNFAGSARLQLHVAQQIESADKHKIGDNHTTNKQRNGSNISLDIGNLNISEKPNESLKQKCDNSIGMDTTSFKNIGKIEIYDVDKFQVGSTQTDWIQIKSIENVDTDKNKECISIEKKSCRDFAVNVDIGSSLQMQRKELISVTNHSSETFNPLFLDSDKRKELSNVGIQTITTTCEQKATECLLLFENTKYDVSTAGLPRNEMKEGVVSLQTVETQTVECLKQDAALSPHDSYMENKMQVPDVSKYDVLQEHFNNGLLYVMDIPEKVVNERLKILGDTLNKTFVEEEPEELEDFREAKRQNEVFQSSSVVQKIYRFDDARQKHYMECSKPIDVETSTVIAEQLSGSHLNVDSVCIDPNHFDAVMPIIGSDSHKSNFPDNIAPVTQIVQPTSADELFQMFFSGSITLDQLCQLNVQLPSSVSNVELAEVKHDVPLCQQINELEQEMVREYRSLHQSKKLYQEIDDLLQSSERNCYMITNVNELPAKCKNDTEPHITGSGLWGDFPKSCDFESEFHEFSIQKKRYVDPVAKINRQFVSSSPPVEKSLQRRIAIDESISGDDVTLPTTIRLNLKGLRSDSSNDSSSVREQKVQHVATQQQLEIRAWMKAKREKRMKSQILKEKTLPSQKELELQESNVKIEDGKLTGWQLRKRSRERAEKRAVLRANFSSKRQEEATALLAEYDRDRRELGGNLVVNSSPREAMFSYFSRLRKHSATNIRVDSSSPSWLSELQDFRQHDVRYYKRISPCYRYMPVPTEDDSDAMPFPCQHSRMPEPAISGSAVNIEQAIMSLMEVIRPRQVEGQTINRRCSSMNSKTSSTPNSKPLPPTTKGAGFFVPMDHISEADSERSHRSNGHSGVTSPSVSLELSCDSSWSVPSDVKRILDVST